MGDFITLTADDTHHFAAYTAGNPEARNGLVIVQEIFGLTDFIKRVCDTWADQHGMFVVAPALFDRVARNTVLDYNEAGLERGMHLYQEIDAASVTSDIRACAQALMDNGQYHRAILGFCWGGTIAWQAATRTRDFEAAIGWYGGGIAAESHEKPHCPVQLHFGGRDPYIPLPDVQKIRANRPEVEIFVYDHADHGFGCDDRASFDRAARDLAQERSAAFLERYLAALPS